MRSQTSLSGMQRCLTTLSYARLLAYLLDLILIPSIRTRSIIRQSIWTSELMIARRCSNEIALPGNLSCEPCDGPCHLVYLAENDNSREARAGIVRYCWVVEKNACISR